MSENRRKTIPLRLRKEVWDTTQNPKATEGKCTVCRSTVHILNFECAHIKAHAEGGETTVNNLVVCCNLCNRSMGKMNLYEYMKTYHPENLKYLPKNTLSSSPATHTSSPTSTKQKSVTVTQQKTQSTQSEKTFLKSLAAFLFSPRKTEPTHCSHILLKGPRKGDCCANKRVQGSKFCSKHVQ